MSRYLPYCPDQAELLPGSVRDVLGSDHLCFFVPSVVERLDLSRFHASYAVAGGQLYHPSLLLKVWL
jgi:transposase